MSFIHHTTENATVSGYFLFLFAENWGREITCLSWCHGFRNALFSKCFSSTLKRKAGVFKFHWFEERVRFCDGLVWKAGLTVEVSCPLKLLLTSLTIRVGKLELFLLGRMFIKRHLQLFYIREAYAKLITVVFVLHPREKNLADCAQLFCYF